MSLALKQRFGDEAEIELGWVNRLGEGLYRDVLGGVATLRSEAGEQEVSLSASIPRWDAPREVDDRARSEVEVLDRLGRLDLPFRIPDWAVTVVTEGRDVLVREAVAGFPLELAVGSKSSRFVPWEITGTIAAQVHVIDPAALHGVVETYPTRRDHGEACLLELEALRGDREGRDVLAWLEAHLPPGGPSHLLHGDLLAQNILLDLDLELAPALIDWEYARIGDPAYDLAIVTRGRRKPFKASRGFEKLVDAYRSAGGAEVSPLQVGFHEVCLHARWYLESLRGESDHGPDHTRSTLLAVLRRVEGRVDRGL
jgi:aminoglycoside phosphotransferase (APT) family kinase protein